MGTKNFSSANDLITFSRSSAGTALRKISYGPELVTNGTFDTDTSGWSVFYGDFASVGGEGVLTYTDAAATVSQQLSVEIGKVYQITGSITSATTASPRLKVGSTAGGSEYKQLTAAGSFDIVIVASTATISFYLQNLATGYVSYDNISVKEVLFDQGTLTLFNHPADVPRIEYDADGNVLGLLVEESRTNLLTYSEDFEQSLYIKDPTVSVTSTNNLSPSNENNATLITVTDNQRIYANNTSITGVCSVFIKAGTFSHFKIKSNTVDLVTKTVSAGTLEEFPNGWFRYTTEEDTLARFFQVQAYPDDSYPNHSDTGTYYIWGAQLEEGAFPTSYIPTSGSTATRSADVASIATSEFGWNKGAGTVVVDADTSFVSNNATNFFFGNGTSLDDQIISRAGTIRHLRVYNNGVEVASLAAGTILKNTPYKIATVFAENDFAVSLNGNSVVTDSSGSINLGIFEYMSIGTRRYSDVLTFLNGHIKSIKYIPRRLTNAQLQELTT